MHSLTCRIFQSLRFVHKYCTSDLCKTMLTSYITANLNRSDWHIDKHIYYIFTLLLILKNQTIWIKTWRKLVEYKKFYIDMLIWGFALIKKIIVSEITISTKTRHNKNFLLSKTKNICLKWTMTYGLFYIFYRVVPMQCLNTIIMQGFKFTGLFKLA